MAITKLNQTNRIVDFPNRYKLNAVSGQSNTYDLESITGEIIDSGTPFNKIYGDTIDNNFEELDSKIDNTFNEVNNRMALIDKYNSIIGVYDSDTEKAKYELSYLDNINIVNNQRVLITPTNEVYGPIDDFETEYTKTQSTRTMEYPKFIELNNGNIMVGGLYNGNLYIFIIDKLGNIILNPKNIGSPYNNHVMYKLSNGNIIVAGNSSNTSRTGYYAILDQMVI